MIVEPIDPSLLLEGLSRVETGASIVDFAALYTNEAVRLSAVVRVTGISALIEANVLGAFYNPEYGVWSTAMELLARLPCDTLTGFDHTLVKAELALLNEP